MQLEKSPRLAQPRAPPVEAECERAPGGERCDQRARRQARQKTQRCYGSTFSAFHSPLPIWPNSTLPVITLPSSLPL